MTTDDSTEGKILAMPSWHEEVLRERLANPSTESRMTVEEARLRLKTELRELRKS